MLRQINALQAEVALCVAEYDRRGLADDRHALTTSQWLAHTANMTKAAASSLIRTGRALDHMPTAAELATQGKITAPAVRKLAAAHDRHPEAYPLHEQVLAEAATYLAPRDLRRAISHWEQQVAYPDAVAEVTSKRRRRRLSINQTWDGMYAVSGELDPETGHVVSTALRARVEMDNLDPDDPRTHPQKMADALADVCRYSLDHDGHPASSAGTKPHITVEIDYATLAGGPNAGDSPRPDADTGAGPDIGVGIDASVGVDGDVGADVGVSARPLPEIDGLPVDHQTIRKLACDASIVRMVIGPESEVLDVGRTTRTVPSATRRALDRRDRGCTWAGCDAPPQWCDAHHIEHWADGGETNLSNLRLLCRRHHTATHELDEGTGPDPPPPS